MKVQPKEDFVIIHPKEDDGTEIKYSLLVCLSRKLSDKIGGPEDTIEARLFRALSRLDGLDSMNPNIGRYTFSMTIARTFDPDEVITELKRILREEVLSEIVRPPTDIVTP